MALTCTPGGATDNSYVTLAQADAYFDADARADEWDTYSDADKSSKLVQATRDIERLGGDTANPFTPTRPRFPGCPYDLTVTDGVKQQALHFPRTVDAITDSSGVLHKYIPEAVRTAVCEQALYLLQQQASPELIDHQALQAQGVQSFSADGMAVTYKAGGASPRDVGPKAWQAIEPFVRRAWGTV